MLKNGGKEKRMKRCDGSPRVKEPLPQEQRRRKEPLEATRVIRAAAPQGRVAHAHLAPLARLRGLLQPRRLKREMPSQGLQIPHDAGTAGMPAATVMLNWPAAGGGKPSACRQHSGSALCARPPACHPAHTPQPQSARRPGRACAPPPNLHSLAGISATGESAAGAVAAAQERPWVGCMCMWVRMSSVDWSECRARKKPPPSVEWPTSQQKLESAPLPPV